MAAPPATRQATTARTASQCSPASAPNMRSPAKPLPERNGAAFYIWLMNCDAAIPPPQGEGVAAHQRGDGWGTGAGRSLFVTPTRLATLATLPLRGRDKSMRERVGADLQL